MMNKTAKWIAVLATAFAAGGILWQTEGSGLFAVSNESEASSQTPSPTPATLPASPAAPQPSTVPSTAPSSSASAPDESQHIEEPETGSVPAWAADNLPSRTVRQTGGKAVVTNASSLYVLVNKKRNLPASYVPEDLVVPDVAFSFSGDSPKKKMRKEAADALEALFAGAKKADITLKAVSGYRAYATQKAIFDNNARIKGEEVANRTSAYPGQSEHQTGLAMDVSSSSAGYDLTEAFGETKEGKWLAAHAAEYGFIIRYPKGMESITGYTYEPWHVRYVGKEAAQAITKSKLTLEQYYEKLEAEI